ncbi:DNA repair protein rad18 [Xylariomycetidae sp. FL0641]|nr:DNA repair protein rad18 [Xylariomycetidae sp. FL0641]
MNDSTLALDSFDDVADSTDWLSTPLSGLASVEAALRCEVCKDLYRTPMLTSCNHTFCSVCIRRALSSDGKCPLCRASEQEVKLRSNWSMEEVVAAFTQARPTVLEFARQPQQSVAPITPQDTNKRRLDDTEDVQGSKGSPPSSKRLRSARLSKSRSMETTAEMARQEAHIPDPEPAPEYNPNDGLVACPICSQRMKEVRINRHLDEGCPTEPLPPTPGRASSTPKPPTFNLPTSSSFSPAPAKRPERLPAMNYSMLKEPALRKKLAEQGIFNGGPRALLERRHREWTTLHNANCDALRPRRKAELLADLDAWERAQSSSSSSRVSRAGAQVRDKDFDGAAWAQRHGGAFQDLIASARRNIPGGRGGGEASCTPAGGGGGGDTPATEPEGGGGELVDLTAMPDPSARAAAETRPRNGTQSDTVVETTEQQQQLDTTGTEPSPVMVRDVTVDSVTISPPPPHVLMKGPLYPISEGCPPPRPSSQDPW